MNRLKPNREKSINKAKSTIVKTTARITKRVQGSCSFCGSKEKGHRITSCKQRKQLQQVAVEYTLGANENGLKNLI